MSSQRNLRPNGDFLVDYKLYFSPSDQKKHAVRQTALRFYENLLRPNYDKYIKPNMREISENHRILFDFQTLKSDADKLNENATTSICNGPFYKFLTQSPELIISLLSCAAANCYFKMKHNTNINNTNNNCNNNFNNSNLNTTQKYPKHSRFKIIARIVNFDFISSLKDLKSHSIEKYVFIRGTVIRIGTIKPLVLQMDYACTRCDGSSTFNFPDGKIMPIVSCPSTNNTRCKAKNPKPLLETAKCIDHQKIRLQELSTDETGGRVPRTIDIELTEDLVDECIPGDVITIGGIVRATKCETSGKQNRTLYQLYIKANSIQGINKRNNEKNGNDENSKLGVVEFTNKDLSFINKLVNESDPFKLLVNSLCPSIFGHEIVKAGLLLAMVSGNNKSIGNSGLATNKAEINNYNSDDDNDGDIKMNDNNNNNNNNDKNVNSGLHIRGDIHMLIVGDPGLGKSQMLRAIARIAPRGVYVSGNTTSIAGLTVTMVRDGGDHALEAGALVMGDQGVCCIDEFDKMGNQHSALLEAMEQQSISIAKSGMVCTLSARTSVIAAANPCGGHYDASKTISENIKMSAPLLSRFDLLFLLLDKPDIKHDQRLSEHVMRMLRKHKFDPNSNSNKPKVPPSPRRIRNIDEIGGISQDSILQNKLNNRKTLQERLEISYNEYKTQSYQPIPESLLRKYIVYARKYCHPKMTSSAKKVLLNFYLELRKEHQKVDSTPITTRQLESLIRLAEARAKVELRIVITENDARDVVEIMRSSLYDVMMDENNKIDFKRSKGASMPKLQKEFKKILQAACKDHCKSRFTVTELNELMSENHFPIDKHDKLLRLMNSNGTLLQKKGGMEYEFSAAADIGRKRK